jgi:hypothetical protein
MTHKVTRWVGSGLTTRRLLVAVLFVAIFAMAVRSPTDTDTWWHLKSGQLMWETGHVLRADPFSHTVAGNPWIDHGWLVQILLWAVYQWLGLGGLALLLAATVTAAMALVYYQCEGRPFVWAMRPQIGSFLLAALVAYLLHRYKHTGNTRLLWLMPLLVAVWVNCHGGFVIAFVLMGCYLVGEALNRLLAPTSPQAALGPLAMAALASIPAVLLNPNTVKMIPYAFQTVSIGPLQDFIQEWAAPDFHNAQFHPFIWLLLLTLGAMGLSRQRADWTDLTLVGVFGYMGLLAARNTALFALVASPVLARHAVEAIGDLALNPRLSWLGALTHTHPPPRPPRPLALLNILLLILVLAGAGTKVGLDLAHLREAAVWGQGLPLDAAAYLSEHDLPGKMFNTYNWGGYLIWSLYPGVPVFVDGRTDLYALHSEVLDDYAVVHWVRPGWHQILDRYDIGFVITERSGLLDTLLAETGGWQATYQDEMAVIYVRTGGTP